MVPKGTHLQDDKVNYYQTEKLQLEFPMDVPYHLDGELFFGSNFDIYCKPGALKIIFNPNGKHFFNG